VKQLVYIADADTAIASLPLAEPFAYELVRPSLFHPTPGGIPFPRFAAYAAMFRGRDYRVALIRLGAQTVHYLAATPPYWRFPFMKPNDVQIGDVSTLESARGHSLAAYSVAETVRRMTMPGRRFWYLVDETNAASIRVAEKAGLVRSGAAIEKGLGILGSYQLIEG